MAVSKPDEVKTIKKQKPSQTGYNSSIVHLITPVTPDTPKLTNEPNEKAKVFLPNDFNNKKNNITVFQEPKNENTPMKTSIEDELPTIENYDPLLNKLKKKGNKVKKNGKKKGPQSAELRKDNSFLQIQSPESHSSANFNFKKPKPANTKSLKPFTPASHINSQIGRPEERDIESEVRHRVKKKVWEKRKEEMKRKLKESTKSEREKEISKRVEEEFKRIKSQKSTSKGSGVVKTAPPSKNKSYKVIGEPRRSSNPTISGSKDSETSSVANRLGLGNRKLNNRRFKGRL